MEQFKTGGSKSEIRPLTGIEENILLILPSSIGLPSVWDSDQSLEICKENATVADIEHTMETNNNIRGYRQQYTC
ncbi:unnamed protein product [Lasius platythorax]|uniref:Uncharacterized protein n=1 Tax=Lasius platythorax TaxID=488582 RepID=A0AAV2NDQ4_9HYME